MRALWVGTIISISIATKFYESFAVGAFITCPLSVCTCIRLCIALSARHNVRLLPMIPGTHDATRSGGRPNPQSTEPFLLRPRHKADRRRTAYLVRVLSTRSLIFCCAMSNCLCVCMYVCTEWAKSSERQTAGDYIHKIIVKGDYVCTHVPENSILGPTCFYFPSLAQLNVPCTVSAGGSPAPPPATEPQSADPIECE